MRDPNIYTYIDDFIIILSCLNIILIKQFELLTKKKIIYLISNLTIKTIRSSINL